MEEHVGDVQLVEYIEQAVDGSYCKLKGWPSQFGPGTQSSKYNGVNLESWYPDTAPTVPSALQWMPYKIAKSVPHVLQPGQGHPLHGVLRYHKSLGWHYRYSMPFKVSGRPLLPSSMISGASDSSLAPITKVNRRIKNPRLKINKKAFVKLNKIALSIGVPDILLRKIDHPLGAPELKLRRIDQQPGFRSLSVLLEGDN